MTVNEYAQIFATVLDEVVTQEATTKWMEQTHGVEYNGGDTIRIPKLTIGGLGNYSRTNGFKNLSGSSQFDYETVTFEMDRAQVFNLDAMDNDETKFTANASMMLGEFARTQSVPETDSYRYAKFAQKAIAKSAAEEKTYTSGTDMFDAMMKQVSALKNKGFKAENLIVSINQLVYDEMMSSDKITKRLDVTSFGKDGSIYFNYRGINGITLNPIMSDRMMTKYTFKADAGYAPADDGKQMNWLITDKAAAKAIVKHSISKIITPELNQSYDGWSVFVREYHTAYTPDNKAGGIFVSYQSAAAAPSNAVAPSNEK